MEGTYFEGIPGLEGFVLDADDPLVFMKEVIYAGDFDKQGQEFSIDANSLDHWHNSISTFKEAGIKIPLPIGHVDDPELNRGEIIGSERKINSRGKQSLFAKVKFRDAEAAKLAKTSDVSLFSPKQFKDGTGTVHEFPIRHIAITDYPVINNLEGFEVIAASFIEPKSPNKDKVDKMALKVLAAQLGLSLSSDLEDDKIEEAIVLGYRGLQSKLAEATKPATPSFEPTPAHIDMLKENRSLKLGQLVQGHHITPAVKTDLATIFCNDESLSLSLSNKADVTSVLFNAVIAALSKNEPVISLEKSGPNAAAKLSHGDLHSAETNPLLAAAEKRAANKQPHEVVR